MRAHRRGSSVRSLARVSGEAAAGRASAPEDAAAPPRPAARHVGLAPRPDLGLDSVDRMGRGQEESAKVRTPPGEIGDLFWRAHLAEEIARRRIDPHAARRGHPDIAALVAFHAVGHTLFERRANAGGEDAPVRQRAVGGDVEHADQRLHRVVDIEELFVRREAEAVRLVEQQPIDQQLRRAAARRDAVDALEAERARPLDPEAGHAPVIGIGEIDRAVGADADVVGAVELLALEMGRENLAPPVRPLAHERGGRVLAHDQVEVGVIGHAVAFVGRPTHLGDAAPGVPAAAHVGRHVREEKIVVEGMPDRPLGEGEPGPDLTNRRIRVDQLLEFRPERRMGHRA